MGKRSDFKRRPQDKYDTPMKGVLPLLPHLKKGLVFAEPCAGRGLLVSRFKEHGVQCGLATDINPDNRPSKDGGSYVVRRDAFNVTTDMLDRHKVDVIITNPPWTRAILHPMIDHFRAMRPTWLLFDADWMHTVQAAPYLDKCAKIVSIGRLKWIPKSPFVGKDNAAWYYFPRRHKGGPVFIGRSTGDENE